MTDLISRLGPTVFLLALMAAFVVCGAVLWRVAILIIENRRAQIMVGAVALTVVCLFAIDALYRLGATSRRVQPSAPSRPRVIYIDSNPGFNLSETDASR